MPIVPILDDADAPTAPGNPCAMVMSLAWFKARQVLGQIALEKRGDGGALPRWLVAADTMCVQDGRVFGKPADEAEMLKMLRAMQGRMHEVVTGVCIVDRHSGRRQLFFDAAQVHVGGLSAAQLETYRQGDQWRGRAGGYNLQDRIREGWPIRCEGDPETVEGLPSRLVLPAIGVHGGGGA